MSKFKKGDRVRVDHYRARQSIAGRFGTVADVFAGDDMSNVDIDSGPRVSVENDLLKLVPPPLSPIREKTVTTKELEPGDYGPVKVYPVNEGSLKCAVSLGGVLGNARLLSAPELREAARIFTDLASYLEDEEAGQ